LPTGAPLRISSAVSAACSRGVSDSSVPRSVKAWLSLSYESEAHCSRGCCLPRLRRTSAARRASSSTSSKGLGEEIVGAQVQAAHPVLQRALRGEDEHGRAVVGIAHVGQHAQAVLVGQAQVQHDGVVFGAGHEGLGGARIGRVVGHEAALGQRPDEPRGHVQFVFDQEDAHEGPVSAGYFFRPRPRSMSSDARALASAARALRSGASARRPSNTKQSPW
jgi:hypothetical protein